MKNNQLTEKFADHWLFKNYYVQFFEIGLQLLYLKNTELTFDQNAEL